MFDAIYVEGNSYPERREDGLDRAISALADRQHGELSRAQLIELGLTADNIKYRLRVGRLHLRHRSVYGLALRPASKEARWMGAVLAGGYGARLSRHSSSELWGLEPGFRTPIDVSVPRARRPRSGLAFRRIVLPADEVTIHHGIRLPPLPGPSLISPPV